MLPVIAVLLATAVAAFLTTPIAAKLAHAKGWVDAPGLRKVHKRPVAYLGGVGVFSALVIGCATLWILTPDPMAYVGQLDPRVWAIIAGGTLMFAVGLVDDIKHLRPRHKLVAQLAAALIVFASGVSIDGLRLTESVHLDFGVFAVFVTVFWIVGVTNAVNFIDGLDGLASGISTIAAAAIAWTAFQTGHAAAGFMMVGLAGALIGFLPYNLHPARVFQGDAGSLLLGFLLSSTAALTASKAPTLVGFGVPLVALGIPILDTLFSMLRRFVEGRSMMSADRNHIHHRLMQLGYGQPKTVLILCSATAIGVLVATSFADVGNLQRIVAIAAAIIAYMFVFRATGAVRLKDSMAAVQQAAAVAKEENDLKQLVDELELRFREVADVKSWWAALTRAAERLRFESLELRLDRRDGTTLDLRWDRAEPGGNESPNGAPLLPAAEVALPLRGRRKDESIYIDGVVAPNGVLENSGRAISVMCRLLDRHGLTTLPVDEPVRRKAIAAQRSATPA